MIDLLRVLTVLIVALTAALSVAHALELPGKMRLDEATYRAVQRIYYPGFTIGGVSEGLGVIATGVLLVLTPAGTPGFWLALIALLATLAVVAIYWLVVHPVNKYWMADHPVGASGASFFGIGAKSDGQPAAWTDLRDRWEYGHVARAVAASIGLTALVISLVVQG